MTVTPHPAAPGPHSRASFKQRVQAALAGLRFGSPEFSSAAAIAPASHVAALPVLAAENSTAAPLPKSPLALRVEQLMAQQRQTAAVASAAHAVALDAEQAASQPRAASWRPAPAVAIAPQPVPLAAQPAFSAASATPCDPLAACAAEYRALKAYDPRAAHDYMQLHRATLEAYVARENYRPVGTSRLERPHSNAQPAPQFFSAVTLAGKSRRAELAAEYQSLQSSKDPAAAGTFFNEHRADLLRYGKEVAA